MKTKYINWLIYAVLMVVVVTWLGWGKPNKIIGMFFVSGLAVGSLYALGGIGLVVLFRATGVLNFANGAAGAAGVMTAWQFGQWGVWAPLTWAACILVALLISLFYGRMIAPLLAWREPVVKAVATLGFALIILGLVSFLWIDDPRSISLPTDKIGIKLLGLRVTATRMIVFLSTIGLVIAIYLFLGQTKIGLNMRALANDRDLSALIGIPILKVETIAWGLSGLIAGFTGLMFGDLIRLEPTVITFMVIPSIAAAICGRLDNLVVVLVGGLSMGVIESLLTLSPVLKGARPIAPFVIASLVLLWSQRGTQLTFGGRD
ncbi:branched-chain amino acid ABC transporter permease [Parasedimentitalea huanghaiensis]|uniref:Branched-chain amino acid ABC transporter permease n=1 Tax=Parasedimentitalea huanghaiensis TaxID=2682100 RepID=A0A6L6WFK6_9RHOB|nr:branched-chain amino acid ABC transporter permease [Zongyanglinia huanghaiensis]MVO16633.1 branched-chain amino acid ABC transporter permease [Zongyanglinia huanghaiensis]